MKKKSESRHPWPLIFGLAAIALVRPILSMIGALEQIGQPAASITLTVLISLVWIAAAVSARVERPAMTLMLTGIAYAVLAILLSAILSPIVTGRLQGPLTNPFAIVSMIATNAIWGLVAGGIATVFARARHR